MKRRTVLTGLGTVAIGAAVGSGAFDSVEAEREVTANLAGDDASYLGIVDIEPYSEEQTVDGLERIKIIDLNSVAGEGGGQGVGPSSDYFLDEVFGVENRGTETVHFWADVSGVVDDFELIEDFYLYSGDPDGQSDFRENRLEGEDEAVLQLDPGDSATIGVFAETDRDTEGDEIPETPAPNDDPATLFANVDDPGSDTIIDDPEPIDP